MHIKREEVSLDSVKITAKGQEIFYYDIFSVQAIGIYSDTPEIKILARHSQVLTIYYKSNTYMQNLFEVDLNYIIESILED